jgi:hypothetical protein
MSAERWHQVMSGLRGVRLALYDEMLCNGCAEPARTEAQAEAERWLVYHQFAWHDTMDGYLRPRPIARARELWEKHGPAKTVDSETVKRWTVPEAIASKSTIASTSEAERPAVHAGQMEVFALEGYGG